MIIWKQVFNYVRTIFVYFTNELEHEAFFFFIEMVIFFYMHTFYKSKMNTKYFLLKASFHSSGDVRVFHTFNK